MKNSTPKPTARRLNTVQTVLSERAVNHLECILYWFWNDFDSDCLTKNLMQMLSVYIKANPDNVHLTQKPDWMAQRVSEILQLNEQLTAVQEMDEPWNWINAIGGWELPAKEAVSE